MTPPRRGLSTEEYLRHARKLRAEYAGQPRELQARLRDLNARRDVSLRPDPTSVDGSEAAVRVHLRRAGTTTHREPLMGEHRPERSSPTKPHHRSADAPEVPASPAQRVPGVLGIPPLTAERFAAEVETAIDENGGLLRYTSRKRLLARANRLGIKAFDANLLIASVLHARPKAATRPTVTTTSGRGRDWLVILAMEAVLVAGTAWLLLG